MEERKYIWHKIAHTNEFVVAEGIVMTLNVADRHICITQIEGAYYAFQSKCPHAGASFEHAWFNAEAQLVCPLHRFCFDVRTGRNTSGEGFHLMRYPVKQDERGTWVGIPEY